MTKSFTAVAQHKVAQHQLGIFGGSPLFDAYVPIVRPEVPPECHEDCSRQFLDVLGSGLLTNGRSVQLFEEIAAERLGVAECVAVSNCTAGLMLTLRCLGLQEGEVILPSFTFFASGHAAVWNGLTPVLVDCERDTFNLDPQKVREAITRETVAILAVHIFGNPAAAEELEAIAKQHGIKLIFDAAHGFGAAIHGKPVGGSGDAEVFSLSPTKLLVAGEGGIVATNNVELAQRLRLARNYGDGGSYDCEVMGLNARMTEFQAVVGVAGVKGIDERSGKRERIANAYVSTLASEPGVSFQRVRMGYRSSRKDLGILFDEKQFGVSRDFLRAALEKENVQTRKYFDPPLHRQKLYRGCRAGDLRNTEWICQRILNPPVYTALGEKKAEEIAQRILLIRDNVQARGYPSWWKSGAA